MTRYSAGLPIVVVIESSDPAVIVDGRIEMNLVTTGTEVRRLIPDKRLHERPAMRLRIHINDEVVQGLNVFVFAIRQLMQRGIRHHQIALSHRALDRRHGMTRDAPESGVCFRLAQYLLDRRVHHSG